MGEILGLSSDRVDSVRRIVSTPIREKRPVSLATKSEYLPERNPPARAPLTGPSPRDSVPGAKRIESVFLNIPNDGAFEGLYLAYIVGLTQLGLRINTAIAVPNQDRLNTIIQLIERSDFSIHDLSRI